MKYVSILLLLVSACCRADNCVDYSGTYHDLNYKLVITQKGCSEVETKYYDLASGKLNFDHVFPAEGTGNRFSTPGNGSYSWFFLSDRLVSMDIESQHLESGDRVLISQEPLSKNTDDTLSDTWVNIDSRSGIIFNDTYILKKE